MIILDDVIDKLEEFMEGEELHNSIGPVKLL